MNSKAKNWETNSILCEGVSVDTQVTVLGHLLEQPLFELGDFGHQGKGARENRDGNLYGRQGVFR